MRLLYLLCRMQSSDSNLQTVITEETGLELGWWQADCRYGFLDTSATNVAILLFVI